MRFWNCPKSIYGKYCEEHRHLLHLLPVTESTAFPYDLVVIIYAVVMVIAAAVEVVAGPAGTVAPIEEMGGPAGIVAPMEEMGGPAGTAAGSIG
jgi:hypothetical protein